MSTAPCLHRSLRHAGRPEWLPHRWFKNQLGAFRRHRAFAYPDVHALRPAAASRGRAMYLQHHTGSLLTRSSPSWAADPSSQPYWPQSSQQPVRDRAADDWMSKLPSALGWMPPRRVVRCVLTGRRRPKQAAIPRRVCRGGHVGVQPTRQVRVPAPWPNAGELAVAAMHR